MLPEEHGEVVGDGPVGVNEAPAQPTSSDVIEENGPSSDVVR